MRVTGETAIRLAERYGLPIHKQGDAGEGFREDIPLEDAQCILREGDPESIYTEAEPELIAAVTREVATGTPGAVPAASRGEGGGTR
jgi:hypothetical protein